MPGQKAVGRDTGQRDKLAAQTGLGQRLPPSPRKDPTPGTLTSDPSPQHRERVHFPHLSLHDLDTMLVATGH